MGFAETTATNMVLNKNMNKYQESRMLFFADPKKKPQKASASRPKTIQEIKKLRSFVKHYREEPGKSLNASIKNMARRDESFNEFLRTFKAKNE